MRKLEEIEEEILCETCKNPIDHCKCVCPYCGEIEGCTCCIGFGCATGG